MRRALSLIGERLSGVYGANELAADLGMSRSSLGRMFAAELETTPSGEFMRQRIARAKALLSAADEPMKAVAARCGFCDGAHFANAFRRATGLTPLAYRRTRR